MEDGKLFYQLGSQYILACALYKALFTLDENTDPQQMRL